MNSGDIIIILVIITIASIGFSALFISVANATIKISKQLSEISKTLSQISNTQKKQLRK